MGLLWLISTFNSRTLRSDAHIASVSMLIIQADVGTIAYKNGRGQEAEGRRAERAKGKRISVVGLKPTFERKSLGKQTAIVS